MSQIVETRDGRAEAPLAGRITPASHRAVVRHLTPLYYDAAPAPGTDVPAHVRAASSIRLWGNRLLVVQDDVSALAITGAERASVVLLPTSALGERSFDEQRGNKARKLDLEASIVLPDGRVVAFGSGSTRARERIVVLTRAGVTFLHDGNALYAALRACAEFSGSELNIEGAVVVGEVLRLFQRGNGAVVDGALPINATADVTLAAFVEWLEGGGPAPVLSNVVRYDLGRINGVPWTFTDATVVPGLGDGGTQEPGVVFVGAAEDSPDTYRDGEVLGSCIGVLAGEHTEVLPVEDESGNLAKLKLEGIEYKPSSAGSFWVVADMDDPTAPALLAEVTIEARPRR